ncbi:MAG: hypothetical protein LBC74_02845 [Planctomycetaceae bacterium]|nr:hypothetical protein [Planctomycetaceae bacterium]
MMHKFLLTIICTVVICMFYLVPDAQAQQGFGRQWAGTYQSQDWQRFMYYPYIYYPHNYYSPEYFRSSEDVYNRYPAEMRIPAYNKDWINFFPEPRKYHRGHHFRLSIL